MRKLYFVRHGQTFWNVENKICGATDIGLTELGHEQAKKTGERILAEGLSFDMIYASPLSRAADTARHISEMTHVPMRIEPRLIEQNFGRYEGTPRNGEEFLEARHCFIDSYQGGESMFRLAQRIYNLLDEIRDDQKERTIMLVAHNGIARVVQSYFYDMTNDDYARFGVPNCAVLSFDLPGRKETG